MASLHELLRHDDPLETSGMCAYPYKPALERKYKFFSRFGEEVDLFHRDQQNPDVIWLPRALCPVGPNDKRTDGKAVVFPKKPTPKPNQVQLFAEVNDFLLKGQSGLALAYTGFGKTVVGFNAAAALQRKTLVITTKDDIYKQWLEGAQKFLGLPWHRVGEIRQDKCEVVDTDFCVAMIHSLSQVGKYPSWIVDEFGLVIFDECNPAGTLVDGVPIEDRKVGDEVWSYGKDGLVKRRVSRVTKKTGDRFVKIEAGDQELVSTEYHPVFVHGVGFIPQALMEVGDVVYSLQGFGGTHETEEAASRQGPAGDLLSEVSSGSVVRAHDEEQSDLHAGSAGQDRGGSEREAFTVQTWREREGFDEAATAIVGCFVEFDPGARAPHRLRRRSVEEGLAEIVRRGHCTTREEACDRARWAFAQYFEGAGFRCPEGQGVGFVRVDRVEVKERAGAVGLGWCGEDGSVYELEIDDTHTFFANGVLTHNCHRVPADNFQTVAGMFPARLRLGLTATLERSDGKELMLHAHIGPVRAKTQAQLMVPKVLRYNTGWLCPRVPRTDKDTGQTVFTRMPHEPGRTVQIEKVMAANDDRNHMICEVIQTCYDKGKKIVVFSNLIDHLKSLQRHLVKLGVSGKDIGFYIGATTKAEKEAREKVKVKPVILTTYTMMAEGTDIPWLDTCVLALPRARVTQPVGRVRREYEGKGTPIVIDFIDGDSAVFAGYAASRKSWYDSINAAIIDMD